MKGLNHASREQTQYNSKAKYEGLHGKRDTLERDIFIGGLFSVHL
jgi:hypothetical protein